MAWTKKEREHVADSYDARLRKIERRHEIVVEVCKVVGFVLACAALFGLGGLAL